MIRYIVASLILFGATSAVAMAQSQERTVTQLVTGIDISSPSVPTGLTATGLSVATVELNWNASVDNVGVSAYRVWRDGLNIATTTLLSYTDVGLATSTSYNYYLTAIDAAGNESASSSVVVGTTLAPPPPTITPDDTPSGAQFTRGADITDIKTAVGVNSITLTFTTDRFVQSNVQWLLDGTVLGVAQASRAQREHRFVIDGLQPARTYTLDITVSIDPRFAADTEQLTLTTQAVPDTIAPANVSNVRARDLGDAVEVTWQNPTDADFDRVRVVRSTRGYPLDLVDGWVVYEDDGTAVRDASTDRPLYYTIFSIDAAGNVSSGAVVAVWRGDVGAADPTMPTMPSSDGLTAEPERTTPPPGFTSITAPLYQWPVYVDQLDRVVLLSTTTIVSLYPNEPFTVRIPASAVPATLKTIVVELYHPDSEMGSFSFLLRRNNAGTAYEARIGMLPDRGTYDMVVRWLDFASNETGLVQGVLKLSATPGVSTPAASTWWWLPWLLGMLVLVLLLRIIVRRRT